MIDDDDPDRDPLAEARAMVRALQEAGDWRKVLALVEPLGEEDAKRALVALGIESLAMRGELERPGDDKPADDDDLPADPFEDDDWLGQGGTTFAALTDLSPLGLFRAVRCLSAGQMRAVVLACVLDEMATREAVRREREWRPGDDEESA